MNNGEPPAIFFHPDAIEGEGKDLVGRRSAGQSFLRGFLTHTPGDHINVVTETQAAAEVFGKTVRAMGETRPIRAETLRGTGDFTRAGTIFFPAPGYLNAAWRRQRFGPQNCSLVGITHTVSTRRVIEGMHHLLSEPVEPWDAVICTSRAVQSVMQRQFALEAEYLTARYGAVRVPQPQLPVIPLGIHTSDFVATAKMRADMRTRFGAPDNAVVVLTVGRWTSIEKANPAPLFMALQAVAKALGKPLHLWMVGWSSRDDEVALHRDGALAICPDVATTLIEGREQDVRRGIWSGADIFTLPVDNIQETFGLVPVEAMAAGLPVVMPDWNGFRDTVLHGETGFLIPTRMARPGTGARIAERFADGTDDYVRYLSMILQHTVIDLPAYTDALLTLARDGGMRRSMGKAGVRHVQAKFDWAAVIPQYLALADALAERRRGAAPTTPRLRSGPINPQEVDPFDLYAAYPTATILPDTPVTPVRALDAADLAALDKLNGRTLYRRKTVPDATLFAVRQALADNGTMTVSEIARATGAAPTVVEPAVLFLAKYGYVGLPQLSIK
jgi:glycosyltransferase involved in cell wall biosynthesis